MEPLKVLIADDEPLTRLDLRTTLEELNYRVIGEAENGQHALTLTRTLRPDLVILDVMMPQMDGLEAARVIRSENLSPVILLTAYADQSMLSRADSAGVFAYLKKPFRSADLPPAISIALGRYRERQELQQEVTGLKEKIESRKVVGRAKALLMERYKLTEREAFQRIQAQSRTLQKPPHEIAQAIITASELGV